MLLTAVETADCPEATPSAYRGVDAIGSPVDLLNRRSVFVGGIDGVKMTFAPEPFTADVILVRLEGRNTPPVV